MSRTLKITGLVVAITELGRCAGAQFDPMVVDVFCALRAEERADFSLVAGKSTTAG